MKRILLNILALTLRAMAYSMVVIALSPLFLICAPAVLIGMAIEWAFDRRISEGL